MSLNQSSDYLAQPLSISDVVTISIKIYRSHLKLDFELSLIIWQCLRRILKRLSYNFLRTYITNYSVRLSLVLIITTLILGGIIMPFWQSVKAVTYYDLLCRREGIDLKIDCDR
ncbi:MAG: hypothetical protein WA919_24805 [Coleofasciculaceae cyanobacterium]